MNLNPLQEIVFFQEYLPLAKKLRILHAQQMSLLFPIELELEDADKEKLYEQIRSKDDFTNISMNLNRVKIELEDVRRFIKQLA